MAAQYQYGYEPREPAFEDYYRAMGSGWTPAQAPLAPRRRNRREEEEVYARRGGRREETSPRSEEFEDEGYDSGEDYRIRYRRKVKEQRARRAHSADSSRSRHSRRRAESEDPYGREVVRYTSRRRYEGPEESDDDERTICYNSEMEEMRRPSKAAAVGAAAGAAAAAHSRDPDHKCGDECGKNVAFPVISAFRHPEHDEEYDSEEDERERRKRRNKRILYTGLATVGTVATCNGLYQNQKAYRARAKALEESETPCAAELKALRRKKLLQDAIALGVVCVGMNNLRLAWGKTRVLREQDREAQERWEEHRERRDASLGRSNSTRTPGAPPRRTF